MDKLKVDCGKFTSFTPVHVDYKDATWRMAIGTALGTLLTPLLIILSRLLKREIAFMKHDIE